VYQLEYILADYSVCPDKYCKFLFVCMILTIRLFAPYKRVLYTQETIAP